MDDFKDRMIEAIERGEATELDAYEIVRDRMADQADRKEERVGAVSGISDYDRAHIADIVAGHGDWFTAHLLRLIAKADGTNRAKLKFMYSEEVKAYEEWEQRGAPQSNLRLVPMGTDYWHVVSDNPASIIGSLLYASGSHQWRAEFTGTIETGWNKLEVGYFETQEEALAFMEEALKSHLAEAVHE